MRLGQSLPVQVAIGVDFLLIGLHLANALPIPPLQSPTLLLDLGAEANLPTWWASAQLWTAAALLAYAAWRPGGERAAIVTAAVIGTFSLDEVARLHERVGAATRSELLPVTGLWPILVAPAALAVAAAGAWLARSTWRREPTAAALLAGGILGLVVSGAGVELLGNWLAMGSGAQFIQVSVEESGELLSGTLILAGACRLASSPRARTRKAPRRSDRCREMSL